MPKPSLATIGSPKCVPTVSPLCTVFPGAQLMRVVSCATSGHPGRCVPNMHRKWVVSFAARSACNRCRIRWVVRHPCRYRCCCSWPATSDVSAFCTIIWVAYSNAVVIRFSSLLRTVVADATIYFIMVMGLQTLVLLFITFADVCCRPLSAFTFLTCSLSAHNKPIPAHVRKISPDLQSSPNSQHPII